MSDDPNRISRSNRQFEAQLAAAAARRPGLERVSAPELLARALHERREALAPRFGERHAEQRPKPWDDLPVQSRRLLEAAAAEVILSLGLDLDEHIGSPLTGFPGRASGEDAIRATLLSSGPEALRRGILKRLVVDPIVNALLPRFLRVEGLLGRIIRKGEAMSEQSDRIRSEVAETKGLQQSAITLIGGLAAEIRRLHEDPEALLALANDLDQSNSALAAALEANSGLIQAPPVVEPPVTTPPVTTPPEGETGGGAGGGIPGPIESPPAPVGEGEIGSGTPPSSGGGTGFEE